MFYIQNDNAFMASYLTELNRVLKGEGFTLFQGYDEFTVGFQHVYTTHDPFICAFHPEMKFLKIKFVERPINLKCNFIT